MTEAQWLACIEPEPMLNSVRGKASERKLRLLSGQFCLAYFAAHAWPESADSTRTIAAEASEHGQRPEWIIEPLSDALPCILLHEDAFTAVVGAGKALSRWVVNHHT
ncbi:MAG TPA: hypothetical protein VM529_00770, partial [Gemmata sp.]|nr:hypothetical protein [Gemmata sp.]